MADTNVEEWEWDCANNIVSPVFNVADNDLSDDEYEAFIDSDYDLSEDDILFYQNVEGGNKWASGELLSETENEDWNSSEGFRSFEGTSDDGCSLRPKFREYKQVDGKGDPIFEVGMIFKNRAQFAGAVRQHAILHGKEVRFVKNEPSRVRAVCKKSCPWKIFASFKTNHKKTLQVKSYDPEHKCGRVFSNKLINSSWLAMTYFHEFRLNPKITVNAIIEKVMLDFNVRVSVRQVYRAKLKTKKRIEGACGEQYGRLWDYCGEILRSNPGTSVYMHFQVDENGITTNKFQRIYICWSALIKGFVEGCRPLLGVDGCHLKGGHGGQLLAAVALDANNQIFPVAYAVVETENTRSWTWFLEYLINDLQIQNESTWTIISDKQKGIEAEIRDLLPFVEHRHCVRHLHNNMKTAGYTSMSTKNRLWSIARASYMGKFDWEMQQLAREDPAAFKWLTHGDKNPKHWSRSHFSEASKCDILLNNLCESFNAVILQVRDKPILTMLERIRMYLMDRLVKRREFEKKWIDNLGPNIHKILEKNKEMSNEYLPALAGERIFEVRGMQGDQCTVDLIKRICSCRRWELTGIPCEHAVAVIQACDEEPTYYVHDWYSKITFEETYKHIMYPLNGQEMWEKTNKPAIEPPMYLTKIGRPKTLRRKEPDEPIKTKSTKLRRYLKQLNCRKCGQAGHNVRTCKLPTN